MPNTRTSDEAAATSPLVGTELVRIVQAGANAKATASQIAATLQFTQTATGAVVRSIQSKLAELITVADFGALLDGVHDDSGAILAMYTAVGYAVIPPGNARIGTNSTFIGLLVFSAGGYLTMDGGVAVSMEGLVQSPRQFIFRGTGTLTFGGNPATNTYSGTREAYAEWFGLQAGSGADQTPFLQAAITAMGTTREGIIYLPMGTITMNTSATCNRGVKIIGKGSRRTAFSMPPDGVAGFVTGGVACWFEGFQFDIAAGSYKNGGWLIDMQHQDCTAVDIGFSACTNGIRMAGSNCQVRNIINTSQPSVSVSGSCLVSVQASDCEVDNVNVRGSGSLFLESIVRVDAAAAGNSRYNIRNIDATVPNSIAVNIVGGSNGEANITVDGVQQGGAGGSAVAVSHAGSSSIHEILLKNIQAGATAATGISVSMSGSGSIQRLIVDGFTAGSGLATGIAISQTAGAINFVKVGLCDLSGVTTPFSVTGTIGDMRINPLTLNLFRKPVCAIPLTIANNGVYVLDAATSVFGSIVLLSINNTDGGMYVMRAAGTPSVAPFYGMTPSTNMANTTGALTGTTGTAGKFTVSTDATGKFYFENRLGVSASVQLIPMTGTQTLAL